MASCGEALPVTVAGPRRIFTGLPPPPTAYVGAILAPRTGAVVGRFSGSPGGSVATAMTVNLTRIYTRQGDDGETHLGDMSRVPKTHQRIDAYGDVDELNAHVGVALAMPTLPSGFGEWLTRIQNDLFDVGADLAVPDGADARERLRIVPEQTAWLEQVCDQVNATLPNLKSFVLPGGSSLAAQLHVCRTTCRRAERRVLAVDGANPEVVRYLNRLSDLLFILARAANAAAGGDEPLWVPGASRQR